MSKSFISEDREFDAANMRAGSLDRREPEGSPQERWDWFHQSRIDEKGLLLGKTYLEGGLRVAAGEGGWPAHHHHLFQ